MSVPRRTSDALYRGTPASHDPPTGRHRPAAATGLLIVLFLAVGLSALFVRAC